MEKVKRFIKYQLQTICVIMDCRRRVKEFGIRNGRMVNTKFLARIASVPEWTITLFNKPRKKG